MASEDSKDGYDYDEYEDVRMELRSLGSNLTSVNVNPRENLFDEIMEDFWEEMNFDFFGGDSAVSTSAASSVHGGSSHSVLDGTSSSYSNSSSRLENNGKEGIYSPFGVQRLRPEFDRYSGVQRSSSNQKKEKLERPNSGWIARNMVEVPELYFNPKFSLVTPSSFEQAINPKDRDSEAQLHRLNMYLDFVEHSLLNQIWIRSDAIFSALDDIKGQKFYVSQALMRLINLRTQLKVLDKRIAVSAIHIPQMQRRLGNESVLQTKMVNMQKVIQGLSSIRSLIEVGDFLGAFELIDESKRLHTTELQGMKAMTNTGKQLDVYDTLVSEVISNKFVSTAIQWEQNDDGNGAAAASEASEIVGNSAELRKLTHALLKMDRLAPAFGMYKSRLINSLRQIVRTCVTEYLVDFDPTRVEEAGRNPDSAQDGKFAEQIRGMPIDAFLSCILICFENLLRAVDRACKVNEYMTATLFTPSDSGAEGVELLSNMKTLSETCVMSSCDVAQRALGQLLTLKKDDMARINLEKMKLLWETAMNFVTEIERIAGSSAYIIRQALHAQTFTFLSNIHERNKIRVITTMDHEKWVHCDVPVEIQASFERLVEGRAMSDKAMRGASTSGDKDNQPTLVIDGVHYKVVWSALELCSTVVSYLDIAVTFSSVTGEIINMIKDLIQLFNKSARMLVLGSGAQKSLAQLRSISAKHLTATAQSLAVLLAVLPHVRAALLSQLPPNRNVHLLELDRVSQDIVEHHGDILSKFVTIVSDSMDSALPRLRTLDWDNETVDKCEYFELLAKNIEALHRVLITDSMLPLEQAQDIFSRVFASLQRKLPKHFETIQPSTRAGRQRILDEVGHLGNALALLRQLDSTALVRSLESQFNERFAIK